MNNKQGVGGPSPLPAVGARQFEVDQLVTDSNTRIIVCCGAGGVGKTTVAAALGVRAAERGRRVVVITIDPAKRLGQALGLTDKTDNHPHRVSLDTVMASGQLFAMVLDSKQTFDEVVRENTTPEEAPEILNNRFYQKLSGSFAGTQDYMAAEKLGQLFATDEWDLIIVDTPPSRSALDFLDAPKRIGRFVDGRVAKLLLTPAARDSRGIMRIVGLSVSLTRKVLDTIIGGELLRDASTFTNAIKSMFGGFRKRADSTYSLLRRSDTAFVVVATPRAEVLHETSSLLERLAQDRLRTAGLIVNQLTTSFEPSLSAREAINGAAKLATLGASPLTEAVLRAHARMMEKTEAEQRALHQFASALPELRLAGLKKQASDIYDLAGLHNLASLLAAT